MPISKSLINKHKRNSLNFLILCNNYPFDRFCLVKSVVKRFKADGLSAIRYPNGANISLHTLHTNISVDAHMQPWNNYAPCAIYSHHVENRLSFSLMSALMYACIILFLFIVLMLYLATKCSEKEKGDLASWIEGYEKGMTVVRCH